MGMWHPYLFGVLRDACFYMATETNERLASETSFAALSSQLRDQLEGTRSRFQQQERDMTDAHATRMATLTAAFDRETATANTRLINVREDNARLMAEQTRAREALQDSHSRQIQVL
jgi:hypothetical protein